MDDAYQKKLTEITIIVSILGLIWAIFWGLYIYKNPNSNQQTPENKAFESTTKTQMNEASNRIENEKSENIKSSNSDTVRVRVDAENDDPEIKDANKSANIQDFHNRKSGVQENITVKDNDAIPIKMGNHVFDSSKVKFKIVRGYLDGVPIDPVELVPSYFFEGKRKYQKVEFFGSSPNEHITFQIQ